MQACRQGARPLFLLWPSALLTYGRSSLFLIVPLLVSGL